MVTLPVAYGVFGYGTAALTYGLYLLTGFPSAETPEEARRVRASLVANGFCFGGIAQFVTGLLLFVFFNDIVGATTFAIFGVLWTAIWLNDYFNLDPRSLTYLDIAIAIWCFFAGIWNCLLGHPVVGALLWSIMVLVIILSFHHAKGIWGKAAGAVALENAILCYYIVVAVVFTSLGYPLPF